MTQFKNYWEVLKAFQEGKTLRYDEKNWYKGQQSLSSFTNELFISNPVDWQIAKSDFDKALDIVVSHFGALDEVDAEQLANLMVEFKNAKE